LCLPSKTTTNATKIPADVKALMTSANVNVKETEIVTGGEIR
jgi:hypothetical protein